MSAQPLPQLLDCRGIMEEMGVKRASAERIMRKVPVKVRFGRRVYVEREAAQRAYEELKTHLA